MEKKLIAAVGLCLLVLACSAPRDDDSSARTPEAKTCSLSTEQLRRPISADNPMFIYNIYFGAATEAVDNFSKLLPAEIKPYFALQLIPKYPIDDTPENRQWIEAILAAADDVELPAFVQTEAFNTYSDIPQEYYADLFNAHRSLIGLSFAEMSASHLTLKPMDDAQIAKMIITIKTVAAFDGYFLWQDMGYENTHVFVQAGARRELFDTISANAQNMIFMDKHNGNGQRFVGPAAAIGFWSSCLAGAWGVNSEDWLWWEAGFGPLFEPGLPGRQKYDDWKAVFTFPDSMFGIDWLADLAGGASVFALEAPFHGFADTSGMKLTPAFENVILPLIRLMIAEHLIPNRDEALRKIEAVHRPDREDAPELYNDNLFRDLYGPSGPSRSEWLPSTGRYYYLPILPLLADRATLDLYPTITDSGFYETALATPEEKTDYFSSLYPPIGEGSAWFVGFEGRWFIANPNENQNIAADFNIPLSAPKGARLTGSFGPHTFAIVIERADRIDIHLNNYRIDSEADVWPDVELEAGDPFGYLETKYLVDPTDDELRQSGLAYKAPGSESATVESTGREGYHLNASSTVDALNLTIDHNGPVDIRIVF